MRQRQPWWMCAALTGWLLGAGCAQGATISPNLERAMSLRGTHADTAVIVRFSTPVDLEAIATTDRSRRDNRQMLALKARAAQQRAAIEARLAALGAQRIEDLWIVNGLAATLPAVSVHRLAELDGVAHIELDSFVQGGRSQRMPAPHVGPRTAVPVLPPAEEPVAAGDGGTSSATPGWNIVAVHAPALWARGYTGRGAVVATMDTGADLAHPDLQRRWRGGTNSWFDPHGQEPSPYDALGHGTQALGVILGGRGLGVAPDARWIGVRLFDGNGRARMSDIHRAFQWLMDPDGDAATIDAPDIVNASWTLTGRATGACITEFGDDIRALRSAGIAVVFAAGNDGPLPRSSSSPANNPGALSVGALDSDLAVARQSSRGPSACDGGLFPSLVAPGIDVRTTDLTHGGPASYARVSGTSIAAPHVAGVLALLMGAHPQASIAELEAALMRGAQPHGESGPDPNQGHGLVDALAAFEALNAARDAHAGAAPRDPRPKVAQGTAWTHDEGQRPSP